MNKHLDRESGNETDLAESFHITKTMGKKEQDQTTQTDKNI